MGATTPEFVRSVYRRGRLAFRSAARALSGTALCRVRSAVIKIGVSTELEQYRAETYATKEPETIDWLDENLRDGDVLMDIGANIGLYALYAAAIRPRSTVYAFEPESQNFSRLCRNIVLNRFRNIIPCNVPLADREGFALFHVGSLQAGSSLHSFGRASGFQREADETVLTQGAVSVTLDDLVEKYGLPCPDLIKLDVDGLEDRILTGAGCVLRSAKLRSILVEWNYSDERALTAFQERLGGIGFRVRRASEWVWEQNGVKSRNFILCR